MHWPGHGALVWDLPGFVSYQQKWLLQRKRRQLDIFMHAEMKPCLQCLMKLCRLKEVSLLLFLLLLSLMFLLTLSLCYGREKCGPSVVVLFFPGERRLDLSLLPRTFTWAQISFHYFCSSSTCSKPTVVVEGWYGSFFRDTINNILQTPEKISRSYSLYAHGIASLPPQLFQS